ncbi:MAG TPA: 2,3-bisphosphoglycerate-independent phosphoglycerate mutase [Candidatus Eisenbacteria bacterium]|nr:2,3-bisphosphoglycerate-independent phosphoglycerate mutase [Candidatus Eisenbacteria bacterium]
MSPRTLRRPLVFCVLDGFGLAPPSPTNAISQAHAPHWARLWASPAHARLSASGEDVGLPAGQFGNSEVGHLNLGAGRIVYQDILRITRAIREGSFYDNEALVAACEHAKRSGGALHFLGLVSDGGVHSHLSHLGGLLELARRQSLERVYLHAFLDGRDTPPRSALRYAEETEKMFADRGVGRCATVSGRYWAMDRDQRWDRTGRAYAAMVRGEGEKAATFREAIERGYERGENDEFVPPTVILDGGRPVAAVRSGDACVCFNFRPDRARQITRALALDDVPFERPDRPRDLHYVCFTRYQAEFGLPIAFPPQSVTGTLGEVYAERGLRQLRLAETEKYAHVTYFFSGGVEKPMAGEDRELIPSPKVATYDLEPEMSAFGITAALEKDLERGAHDLVVMNYANADMVGHTGVLPAAIKAIEALDVCLGRVEASVRRAGGVLLVTADHGNAEQMWDEKNQCPHTAHTDHLVPLVIVGDVDPALRLRDGRLADVAPTILHEVGLEPSQAMTGVNLATS